MKVPTIASPGSQRSARLCAVAGALLLMLPVAPGAQPADVRGSRDHPMISRYTGSVIAGYDFRKFDEFMLPMGPAAFQTQPRSSYLLTKSQKIEGRITRIVYVAPVERTTLEVFRNYEQELRKGGFETLYSCAARECGVPEMALSTVIYPPERAVTPNAFSVPQEQRYIAAKRAAPDGTTHVSILVARNGNPGVRGLAGRVVVLLDVIESAPMDTGMVTVDAAAMAKAIAQIGHIALYGILFDTNKADLKPESQAAIQEIAKLLKQDAALKLLVVGHTDNVGGFDENVALSNRRAAAVLQELTAKHGIAAARLRAVGVGMAAPVARNDTDEGRAKNRRVELVKQ